MFAHEYGHAVQSRNGDLDSASPTIYSEQQADCFAGAWVARAANGEASGVTFSDDDVRNGLIAMMSVRDPVGTDQFSQGGHGSAFDRVGAFQVGFAEGPGRCVELIDDPLPLVPNRLSASELSSLGNLPFGYDDGRDRPAPGRRPKCLLAGDDRRGRGRHSTRSTSSRSTDADEIDCDDVRQATWRRAPSCAPRPESCSSTSRSAIQRHDEFGDFAVGYMLGTAWAEAAQLALDSPLTGEGRALATTASSGHGSRRSSPTPPGTPRRRGPDGPDLGRRPRRGDQHRARGRRRVHDADDELGSGFEKIASFRGGVLEGLAACTARLGG